MTGRPKYRIVKRLDVYYPQRRGWFFWRYYRGRDSSLVCMATLDSATDFVERRRGEDRYYREQDGGSRVVATWEA